MKKYITNRLVLGYDANLVAVVVVSTLVLVLRRYYPLDMGLPQGTALIYYVLIPLMSGLVLFRDRPSDYGIRIGHWRASIALAVVCLALMVPVLYVGAQMSSFRSYYSMGDVDWFDLLLNTALFMFAWEFLFRGYMLFGLERSIGKSAIFVQTIPFVLLHFGKPFLETVLCIPGGIFLGYVAYRTRSMLPCFVIHVGMYMTMVLFANS